MMDHDDADAAATLQQIGAGTRLPLEETTAGNRPVSLQQQPAAPSRPRQPAADRATA